MRLKGNRVHLARVNAVAFYKATISACCFAAVTTA